MKKPVSMIDYYSDPKPTERKQAMENVAQKNEKSISGAIKVDEKEVMEHLDGLVRKSVEDTLNTLLNEEADAICNAGRYQRSPDRQDTRAGTYKAKLNSKYLVFGRFLLKRKSSNGIRRSRAVLKRH